MSYGKRVAPASCSDDPEKRLRTEIVDLFLNNETSTRRISRLATAARDVGADGLEELIRRSDPGNKNASRDLLRYATKLSKWPKLYEANIIGKKAHSEERRDCRVAMLLPHEIMDVFLERNDLNRLLTRQKDLLLTRPDLRRQGANADEILLGLWQDGVPFNSNREHSLETWSLSVLAMPDLRIPLTAWPKDLQVKQASHESMFAILRWSFEALSRGKMPESRHDGSAFGPTDGWRKQRAGKALSYRAHVLELRGDWSMCKSVLGLPGWCDNGHMCWRCNIEKHHLQEVKDTAPWRMRRLSHGEFIRRQQDDNRWLSTFFELPGVTIDTVKLDFLHIADLGTTCDFFGNFLHFVTFHKMRGGNHAQRCEVFFKQEIQPYYRDNDVESRLPCLRPTMLKKEKGTYKLRAKAGEARALVGLLPRIMHRYLNGAIELERAIGFTGQELVKMYECLSHTVFSDESFGKSVIGFLDGLVWLERYYQVQGDNKTWRLKPKSHLLAELGREGINPSSTWTYRDESFGGDLASIGKRLGGDFTMLAVSRQILNRWIAREPFPVV